MLRVSLYTAGDKCRYKLSRLLVAPSLDWVKSDPTSLDRAL
jgi:hypothetical protein